MQKAGLHYEARLFGDMIKKLVVLFIETKRYVAHDESKTDLDCVHREDDPSHFRPIIHPFPPDIFLWKKVFIR